MVAGIAALTILGNRPEATPPTQSQILIEADRSAPEPPAPPPAPEVVGPLPAPPETEVATTELPLEISPDEDWQNERNLVNGMDPEDQPRTYLNVHFHSMDTLPEGYEAEGIILTNRGIELAPARDGEGRRIGSLVSPPEAFEFPTNAFAPMWLEDVPEGTAIMVEVAVSPDGEHWSEFQYAPIDVDHALDIQEYYPDGSPNPNYGYVPGAIYAFGDLLYSQMRYRVTMISDRDDTPSMAAFRMYYMDSTMGSGRMATAEELPTPLIFDDNPLDVPSEFELVYQPDGDSTMD